MSGGGGVKYAKQIESKITLINIKLQRIKETLNLPNASKIFSLFSPETCSQFPSNVILMFEIYDTAVFR